MNDTDTEDVSVLCKNCQHTISMHLPNCTGVSNESHTKICNCNKPEFYNVIISGKYIG
ncbi:MAG TPA: hypothetical protein VFP49_08345 [Nitrososphaeraceae archaeon]|nr:hypothetical protein [Nitrososphaeraceae archaeon]